MDAFWPGPLTLLLPKTSAIPDSVTAGRPLVGVRIPAHAVAQALLRAAGLPIAAPSANTFGHTSPTTAEHVLADLEGRIDAVLDGGPTAVGLESTVCEVTADGAIVYRPGGVTVQMLESVLAQGKITLYHPEPETAPASLPSPGVGIRHYAPRARLALVEVPQSSASDCLLEPARRALEQGARLGVMLPDDWLTDSRAVLYLWARWSDPATLAQRLFAGLRALDDAGVDLILCPVPTGPGIAEAIRDRLEKAAKQT
jgi:L-threonylcarbamoyladenylate synthase